MRALSAHGPETIGQVLFDQWYLGLDCEFDVGEVGLLAVIARDAGQDPGAAFLIHETARAVDWIDNDAQHGFAFGCVARQDDLSVRQAFRDEHDRILCSDLSVSYTHLTLPTS